MYKSALAFAILVLFPGVGRSDEPHAPVADELYQPPPLIGSAYPVENQSSSEELPAAGERHVRMALESPQSARFGGDGANHSIEHWHRGAARPGTCWLRPFESRALNTDAAQEPEVNPNRPGSIPQDFMPWWQQQVANELRPNAKPYRVDVHSLVYGALKHSHFVRGISKTPLIREFKIVEAEADFDVTAFMDSKFLRASEPIGNTLTTGGPPRFRDNDWDYTAGVRKRTATGGTFEFAQQLGYQNNNSEFFVPKQQGTSRLALSFTQPFLNGKGRIYNTSLVVLAQIDTGIAWDQLSDHLQDHLLEVTDEYWRLYLGRVSLIQHRRHYERAQAIFDELEGRRNIDAMESQIALARAAVATRKASLDRAGMTVRNAETHIRSLVNSPELTYNGRLELIPAESPTREYFPLSIRDAMLAALQNRPEVDEALAQIQAAQIRLDMSKNEMLPILNFVMETYVSGLEGSSDVGTAWTNQFSQGEPSYSLGFLFEMPLHNRAAIARHKRRRLEFTQVVDQFNSRMNELMAEVEVAVREVNTYYTELSGYYRAMHATQIEHRYYRQRWSLLPGEDQATSFLLEDLLNSQDRLAVSEFSFATAETAYAVSLSNLSRAIGTLLDHQQVSVRRACQGDLPELHLDAPLANANEVLPPPGPVVEKTSRYPLQRLPAVEHR
jgi:outer membrane protein